MTKAEDMIAEMIANPQKFIFHPKDQRMKQRKERITIKFPAPVELRYWSDPNTGQSTLSVEPIEEEAPGLTTADVAALLGTTERRLREALRTMDLGVGQGKRYDLSKLTAGELAALREKVSGT